MIRRHLVAALCAATALSLLVAGAASAAVPSHTLSVAKVGQGYVSGPGIDCGTDCVQVVSGRCEYDGPGSIDCTEPEATVTATGRNGFAFAGWAGCDSAPSDPQCAVILTGDRTVTATFVDVQDPTVALSAPVAGGTYGGTLPMAATASDNAAVARVDFYVRGVRVGSDTTAPYALSFDTTTVADGSAVVEAQAVDVSGRASARSGRAITIANRAAPAASAPPAISGAAAVGSTLTASTGTWTGSPTRFTYSWLRCDVYGAGCVAIGSRDATDDARYTAVKDDLGRALRVAVTAHNAFGASTSTSAATAPVAWR